VTASDVEAGKYPPLVAWCDGHTHNTTAARQHCTVHRDGALTGPQLLGQPVDVSREDLWEGHLTALRMCGDDALEVLQYARNSHGEVWPGVDPALWARAHRFARREARMAVGRDRMEDVTLLGAALSRSVFEDDDDEMIEAFVPAWWTLADFSLAAVLAGHISWAAELVLNHAWMSPSLVDDPPDDDYLDGIGSLVVDYVRWIEDAAAMRKRLGLGRSRQVAEAMVAADWWTWRDDHHAVIDLRRWEATQPKRASRTRGA
jgi:hypothetical protein